MTDALPTELLTTPAEMSETTPRGIQNKAQTRNTKVNTDWASRGLHWHAEVSCARDGLNEYLTRRRDLLMTDKTPLKPLFSSCTFNLF